MTKKDYSKFGNDIKAIIHDAMNSTEFKELNHKVRGTVNQALHEVKKSRKDCKQEKEGDILKENEHKKKNDSSKKKKKPRETISYCRKKPERELIEKFPKGRISGILLIIFGNIGIGITFISFLMILLVLNFNLSIGKLILLIVGLFPILLINIIMLGKGLEKRGRVKRFKQYVDRLNDRKFCEVIELSEYVDKSNKYVVKDLHKMIRLGMFKEGRLDEKERYLFINNEVYEAHLKMLEGKRLQKQAESEHEELLQQQILSNQKNPELRVAREVINEGNNTIIQIREANDQIQSQVITEKLERLEKVISKIFEYIEENPKEVPEIRKFMGYYLPTTLKIVLVYKDLDQESVQGKNIRSTKKEIEETLDTIENAFENLYDGFYEDTAFDVSSDISVLNTMLAQEGLMNSEFNKKGE